MAEKKKTSVKKNTKAKKDSEEKKKGAAAGGGTKSGKSGTSKKRQTSAKKSAAKKGASKKGASKRAAGTGKKTSSKAETGAKKKKPGSTAPKKPVRRKKKGEPVSDHEPVKDEIKETEEDAANLPAVPVETESSPEKKMELEKVEKEEADDLDPEARARGDSPMSVVGHLDELRSRLITSLVAILVVTLAGFFISEEILTIINKPYLETGFKLNVFNLTEGFLLRLKASLIAGILIGLPVITYEIWRYILPAIEKEDRKFIGFSILGAVFLFYGGILFTYFLILPFAVKMLLSFTPPDMANTVQANNYLSFVLLFSLGMALMFELPIVILILTRIGILTPELLIRKRKYAVVLIFIIAAMITPPDVLTQLMLALPVMLLYEVSIIISKFVMKRKRKKDGVA